MRAGAAVAVLELAAGRGVADFERRGAPAPTADNRHRAARRLAVQTEHGCRDAIQQVAVMSHSTSAPGNSSRLSSSTWRVGMSRSFVARPAAAGRRAGASGGRSARAPARRPKGWRWAGRAVRHRRGSAWPSRHVDGAIVEDDIVAVRASPWRNVWDRSSCSRASSKYTERRAGARSMRPSSDPDRRPAAQQGGLARAVQAHQPEP